MADNVIKLPGINYSAEPAVDMLLDIASQKPKNAFVIVWPEDGKMPSYCSSTDDLPVVLMRLNEFIHKLYGGEFGTE